MKQSKTVLQTVSNGMKTIDSCNALTDMFRVWLNYWNRNPKLDILLQKSEEDT